MRWSGSSEKGFGYHALSIERADGDYFIGRNPHGTRDKGDSGLLKREMLDGEGRFRVKKEDLFEVLEDYFWDYGR